MKYRPEIDGLRAVAVAPVILYHAGFETVSGGYLGVDVFFVISGYLITSIILDDLERDTFSLLHFYARRARRILPALFVVVACCVPVAWLLLNTTEMVDFFQSVAAAATFSSNFHFWFETNYFNTETVELRPLLHTWSLAVEEQFYIVYPVLLIALWKRGIHQLQWILIFIFCTSLLAAQFWGGFYPSAAFYMLPTRAWELVIGALCALHLKQRNGVSANMFVQFVALAGLSAVFTSFFIYDEHTPVPSVYTLLPTIGVAAIILFAVPGTVAYKFLALRPLVSIGLISYSAYLWHQPLFAFTRCVSLNEPTITLRLILIAMTFVLAWLSWKFIETPLRTSGASQKTVFRTSAVCSVVVVLIGVLGALNGGLPKNGWLNPYNVFIEMQGPEDLLPYSAEARRLFGNKIENANFSIVEDATGHDWFFDPDDDRTKLLIVGNSHSIDMFYALWFSQTARETFDIARSRLRLIGLKEGNPFFSSRNYESADLILLARWGGPDREALEYFVNRVLGDGKQVVLALNVAPFPEYRGGTWTLFDKVMYEQIRGGNRDRQSIVLASDAQHYREFENGPDDLDVVGSNREIQRILESHSEIIVIDRMDYVCDDSEQRCFSANVELQGLFSDGHHHTLTGVKFFGARIDAIGWLDPILNAVPTTPRVSQEN